MSTPPPRRRRRRPKNSMEEGVEAPRRRKKSSGSKKSQQTVSDTLILKSIVAVVMVFAVVSGMFFFDWRDLGVAVGMDRSPEKLLTDLKYYQKKQLNLIASFQDKEQAKAAVSQLNEITKELAIISFEYDDWDIIEEDDDIQEHLKLAPEIRESMSKISREIGQLRSKHEYLLREEINHLKGNAAFKYYVTQLVDNAKSAGGKYAQKLRLDKAKEGAFKNGYTPVTAETNLTEGMQLQGIGAQDYWEDCIVKAVNQDGTVRVSFHDQNTREMFGEKSSYFDKKLDRDRLRISDVVIQKNATPAGATRRIQGTPLRPGGGAMGRRIESLPAKRPRSDRAF
ncbi:MAG: hypothetical protein P1V19_18080 [Gimesia sp.]|nr:hypothetical protein [Gimesia sp.]